MSIYTGTHVEKHEMGDYMIDFWGLRPLLDIHPNIVWMWIHLISDGSLSGVTYDGDYSPYIGEYPVNQVEDPETGNLLPDTTIEWIKENGYSYVSDVEDPDGWGVYWVFDGPLPDGINHMDVGRCEY